MSAFGAVTIPGRSGKPRRAGLAMMSDHGPVQTGWLGRQGLANFLEVAGPYLDYAKVRADLHSLAPPAWVRDRLTAYRRAEVFAYPGGILMELAVLQGSGRELLRELAEFGYPGLEISENYLTLSAEERRDLIGAARDAGLEVVYELGRKEPGTAPLDPHWAAGRIEEVIAAGARLAVLERDEVDLLRAQRPEALHLLVETAGERLALEAGPDRFPELPLWLLAEFGTEVSLANLQAGQVLSVERFRRGLDRQVGYRAVTELLPEGERGGDGRLFAAQD